jgi:hypothetical protein
VFLAKSLPSLTRCFALSATFAAEDVFAATCSVAARIPAIAAEANDVSSR